uniref:Tex271 protein n=1 Tax=Mus musculus TaxID=10090 RepID=Q62305_MOUSE|nr:tex271 [Mus musculus]
MKEREEMWQKIEELARLNPQYPMFRLLRHCPCVLHGDRDAHSRGHSAPEEDGGDRGRADAEGHQEGQSAAPEEVRAATGRVHHQGTRGHKRAEEFLTASRRPSDPLTFPSHRIPAHSAWREPIPSSTNRPLDPALCRRGW